MGLEVGHHKPPVLERCPPYNPLPQRRYRGIRKGRTVRRGTHGDQLVAAQEP